MRVPKKDSTPITINVPTKLLQKLDQKSKEDGINRTALITIAIRNYLEMGTALEYMPKLISILENSNKS